MFDFLRARPLTRWCCFGCSLGRRGCCLRRNATLAQSAAVSHAVIVASSRRVAIRLLEFRLNSVRGLVCVVPTVVVLVFAQLSIFR